MYLEYTNQVVIPCFVLHNICQVIGDVCVDNNSFLNNMIKQKRKQRQLRIQQRHIVHLIAARVHNALKIQIIGDL